MSRRGTATVASALMLLAGPAIACHLEADPGGPYEADCTGAETQVQLDGSRSGGCLPGHLFFVWTTDCPGGSFDDPTSQTPILTLEGPPPCPLVCEVTLSVFDERGREFRRSTTVTVIDAIPPEIAPRPALIGTLWPPNHKMYCYPATAFSADVSDDCSGPGGLLLVGCASSQPDDGNGDGNTTGDCEVRDGGQTICVRAERDGGDPAGRRYEILAVGLDQCGNASAESVVGWVDVPHDAAD